MYLLQGSPVVIGQAADAVADVELVLTHDGCPAGTEQLIVVQQAARNGVLNGQHADDRGVALDVLKHFLERIAADQRDLLALEILVGGNDPGTPCMAILFIFFILGGVLTNKIPVSLT